MDYLRFPQEEFTLMTAQISIRMEYQKPAQEVGNACLLANFSTCAVEIQVTLNSALLRKEGKDSIRTA
jgi:hypothetical protein